MCVPQWCPLFRTTLSRTHVVVVGQVRERVDRGDAAWSGKRTHESWSQRNSSDGQHDEKGSSFKASVKDEWSVENDLLDKTSYAYYFPRYIGF